MITRRRVLVAGACALLAPAGALAQRRAVPAITADPAGNVPQYLDLLLAAVPALERIAVLANMGNRANAAAVTTLQAAARAHNVFLVTISGRVREDVWPVFDFVHDERAQAVIILRNEVFFGQQRRVASLTRDMRLSSIAGYHEHAEFGGLMSYGQSAEDQKPKLVINARTAKTLGITIPAALLKRADRVIE